jgi:enamine deaminase RidA (YjgF/YER057c/UK114 family)
MSVERLGTTEGMNVPGMKVIPIISYALVHNGIVSLCGIPADPVGDVKVQTRQVLDRIDQLLQMTGTDKSKLLVAQVWLANMSDFDDHNTVWNDWVNRQNPPVRACVGAPALVQLGRAARRILLRQRRTPCANPLDSVALSLKIFDQHQVVYFSVKTHD